MLGLRLSKESGQPALSYHLFPRPQIQPDMDSYPQHARQAGGAPLACMNSTSTTWRPLYDTAERKAAAAPPALSVVVIGRGLAS